MGGMYAIIETREDPAERPPQPPKRNWWKTLRPFLVTCLVGGALALTYSACPICVLAILVFAALTINCLPGLPLLIVVHSFGLQ